MSGQPVAYRVLVEFKRIQTYLFAVPRLRTILGANALLGEALRLKLPSLATAPDAQGRRSIACRLAAIPLVDSDPLRGELSNDELVEAMDWRLDNPNAAVLQGVLSRDGGHFQAIFDSRERALAFSEQASAYLSNTLVGLPVDIAVECWSTEGSGESARGAWNALSRRDDGALRNVFEPADTEMCELSGREAATHVIEGPRGTKLRVCAMVHDQWMRGKAFADGRTEDVASLLQRLGAGASLPCMDSGAGWLQPQTLEELAGGEGRYLALIHADGNDVGGRVAEIVSAAAPPVTLDQWRDAQARVESFFYRMRATVRIAVVGALQDCFGHLTGGGARPYQLLMIGGDDLVLAMQAEYALPFAENYAHRLADLPLAAAAGSIREEPLGVGVGIAIARSSYPFSAMRDLAEELLASAKRITRGDRQVSAVDWMVVSQSAVLGLRDHRRQHDLVSYEHRSNGQFIIENLILSAKPYPVLRHHAGSDVALEDLTATAKALDEASSKAGRAQRKALPGLLRRGRLAGEAAVQEWLDDLDERFAEQLNQNQRLPTGWVDVRQPGTGNDARAQWMTYLPDLVELGEIGVLGRRSSADLGRSGQTR